MDHRAWLRVVVFTAMIVLSSMFVYHDIATRILYATKGKSATATVVEEIDEVRRPDGMEYVALIQYEGRTAKIESSSRLPVGSQIAIQYVPRPQGDLVRVSAEGWPWASLFLLGLGVALALAVGQELRGKSWWASGEVPVRRGRSYS